MTQETLPIDAVSIGPRFRKDMGDLGALARSIEEVGLLHPVVVDSENRLIAGLRRLRACDQLGWKEIPIRRVDLQDILTVQAESDENQVRKDFLPTEAVAIGRALEPMARQAAAARQGADRPDRRDPLVDRGPQEVEALGHTVRDIVGTAVGMSGRTYHRAKAVVDAAEEDPGRFGDLPALMDETGQVRPAHEEMQGRQGSRVLQERGKRSGPTAMQSLRGLQQAAVQLQGLAEALDGRLLGDWSLLYDVPEAQDSFAILEQSLPIVAARLKRVLRERSANRATERAV